MQCKYFYLQKVSSVRTEVNFSVTEKFIHGVRIALRAIFYKSFLKLFELIFWTVFVKFLQKYFIKYFSFILLKNRSKKVVKLPTLGQTVTDINLCDINRVP